MKVLLLIAAVSVAGPASAQNSPAPRLPSAPVQTAQKAAPDKPFVYDSVRRQLPPKPNPKDHAAPGIG